MYDELADKLRKAAKVNETTDSLMNRDEDKYLVSKTHFEKLTSALRDMLKEGDSDTEVRFNINKTTYLDTVDLDCLKDAVSAVKPRFKVRIRHYAPNGGKFEDVAYLELKIKTETGFTKKTRIRIPASRISEIKGPEAWAFWLGDLQTLVNLNRDLSRDALSERIRIISDVLRKYGFRKQIAVMYERRAYSNSSIRVTVDDEVKYLEAQPIPVDAMDNVPGWGKEEKLISKVRSSPFLILEVKHETEIPKWLKKLLKEVDAKKVGFSKYCAAVASSIKDQGDRGDVTSPRPVMDVRPLMQLMGEPQVEKSKKDRDIVKIAAVVLRDKNFILLGKRTKNDKWGLPGGRFEDDEKKEEVALRELYEETGIEVEPSALEYVGKKTVKTSSEIKIVYVFTAKYPGGEPTTKHDPDEEFTEWQWVRCEDGMLPSKVLEDEINSPSEAAFEKMGLTKSDSEDLTDKLRKTEDQKQFACVVPVNSYGEVLVGKRREDGIWTTPAGQLSGEETPRQCAVRECFEEAKLMINPDRLELLKVKSSPNGHPVYCYLYRTDQSDLTSRLDPDQEVVEWKWTRPEELSKEFTRKNNQNRLETIREALMKYHGLVKGEDMSQERKLAEKLLEKGGPGSGVKGHHTAPKVGERHSHGAMNRGLTVAGLKPSKILQVMSHAQKYDKTKNADSYSHEAVTHGLVESGHSPANAVRAMSHVNEETRTEEHRAKKREQNKIERVSPKRSVTVPGDHSDGPKVERVSEKRSITVPGSEVKKGGPGSGVKGHLTPHQAKRLNAVVQPAKNKLQTHLHELKHGAVLPNVATSSGKPVVNDINAARAHKYTMQDHLDAIDAHHQHAKRIGDVAEKLKSAGRPVPKEAKEMVQHHVKQMKAHMREHDALEMKHNNLKITHEKLNPGLNNPVKKSQTQMGGGIGDPDVDTGNFSQAKQYGDQSLMEKFYRGMDGYQYGDSPVQFEMDKGTLHLSRVDDGMYSGYFTRKDGDLLDNARVRIDKINIPDLAALCAAKEWNSQVKASFPPLEEPQAVQDVWNDPYQHPMPPSQATVSKFDDGTIAVSEAAHSDQLPSSPPAPPMAPNEAPVDKTIRILSLLSKLVGN